MQAHCFKAIPGLFDHLAGKMWFQSAESFACSNWTTFRPPIFCKDYSWVRAPKKITITLRCLALFLVIPIIYSMFTCHTVVVVQTYLVPVSEHLISYFYFSFLTLSLCHLKFYQPMLAQWQNKDSLSCLLQAATLQNFHWHTEVDCIFSSIQTRC